MPRWAKITILVLVAWYIFSQPAAAGNTANGAIAFAMTAGNSIITFLSSIHLG